MSTDAGAPLATAIWQLFQHLCAPKCVNIEATTITRYFSSWPTLKTENNIQSNSLFSDRVCRSIFGGIRIAHSPKQNTNDVNNRFFPSSMGIIEHNVFARTYEKAYPSIVVVNYFIILYLQAGSGRIQKKKKTTNRFLIANLAHF